MQITESLYELLTRRLDSVNYESCKAVCANLLWKTIFLHNEISRMIFDLQSESIKDGLVNEANRCIEFKEANLLIVRLDQLNHCDAVTVY